MDDYTTLSHSRPCLRLCLSPMGSPCSAPSPDFCAGLSLAARPLQSNLVCLTKILNLHPPLVGSVVRYWYLFQRHERRAPLVTICFFLPLAGYHTFYGEDDPRPVWLPRLCAGWEMPACFHPRVQLEGLRVVGAWSENSHFLTVTLNIALKNQVCGLPLSLSGWYVTMTL